MCETKGAFNESVAACVADSLMDCKTAFESQCCSRCSSRGRSTPAVELSALQYSSVTDSRRMTLAEPSSCPRAAAQVSPDPFAARRDSDPSRCAQSGAIQSPHGTGTVHSASCKRQMPRHGITNVAFSHRQVAARSTASAVCKNSSHPISTNRQLVHLALLCLFATVIMPSDARHIRHMHSASRRTSGSDSVNSGTGNRPERMDGTVGSSTEKKEQ